MNKYYVVRCSEESLKRMVLEKLRGRHAYFSPTLFRKTLEEIVVEYLAPEQTDRILEQLVASGDVIDGENAFELAKK